VLCRDAHGQYVTAEYLYLDTANGVGRHAAAAHPLPLLWHRSTQSLEKIGESGLLLGVRADEPYGEREFHFDAGDRLLLYTDGLTEAENASGESFGDAALGAFIEKKQECGTEQFVELLLQEAVAWSHNGQKDDITILAIDLKDTAQH
jgi:sigma-B regulation protein RsbU (phosphoserine phosphatase)